MRKNLDGVVSEEIQNQDIPPQFSRSESKVQDEKIEQEQFSEKKESEKMVKHQPSRRTNSSSKIKDGKFERFKINFPWFDFSLRFF